MKRSFFLVSLLGLLLAFGSLQAADFKESRRLMPKRPGHSQSPLPCAKCHLAQYPELQPKLTRVTNQLYLEECGDCHLAYQPELLPRESWKKIMSGLKDHFGDDVQLSEAKHYALSRYIYGLAGDKSPAVYAKRAMESLKGASPLRLTEIPYLKETHKDVSAAVLARKSIRSLANCEACHMSADGGLYYKPHIHIPE